MVRQEGVDDEVGRSLVDQKLGGEMGRKRLDLTEVNGGKFGWLRAVKPAPDFNGRTAWYFRCTRCKRKKLKRVETTAVMHMGVKSCGCYAKSCLAKQAASIKTGREKVTRRFVKLRKRGLSHREIAEKCGVSRQAVTGYFMRNPELAS